MSTNDTDFDKLIKRLSQLPELEPPSGIVNTVMERIEPAGIPFWKKLFRYLTTSHHIILRPMPIVVSTALLAAVFWLGMLAGMHRDRSMNQPERHDISERAMQDVETSFLVGRGLMAAGLSAEALPLLQKASLSEPANPEYAYWEGLCYWANGMPDKERSSYIRGLSSSPDMVPILLNLGHNLLGQGELSSALVQYNKVLATAPREQAALYNRGLIYHLQQDIQNEITAWKNYLQNHRTGKNSFRAVERLNNLNDFTYRTYQLGSRKTILSQSALLSMHANNEMESDLEVLANGLRNDHSLELNVVVFNENNTLEAKEKAIFLKKNILALLGGKEGRRVKLSWFGEREVVQTSNGNSQLTESLLLFGSRNFKGSKETEI